MTYRLLAFFFLFIDVFFLCAQPSAGGGRYLFVFDASGSMWQKNGADYKIAVAKSVMKDLVQKLPASAQAGLIAYGHTRKSDCSDIETLVDMGPIDKAGFSAKLDAIDPKGMTPIARSLQIALDAAEKVGGTINIILISDGLETCEGNACELIRNARAQGATITVHVVGFGIAEKDVSALECIAQAGGGQYLPAENAGELATALEKTIELPVIGGGYVSVKVTLDGKPIDAIVKVFVKGEKKERITGRTYRSAETNPRVLQLPVGEYQIEVSAIELDGRPVPQLESIEITAMDTVFKVVDFSKGSFEILVTRNGVLSDALVKLYNAGTKTVAVQTRSYTKAPHNPVKLDILPGNYDIEISSVEVANKSSVRFDQRQLAGGQRITLSHNFQSAELKVGARQGSALVDATVAIYDINGKQVANGRTYQLANSNPKTFVLTPGEYEVRLKALTPSGLGSKTLKVSLKEKGAVEVVGEW